MASVDIRSRENKKVSISAPNQEKPHTKIKRRQTGFVRPEDLEKIHIIKTSSSELLLHEEREQEAQARKVRIAPTASGGTQAHAYRRPTGFVRPQDIAGSEDNVRQSVLTRLYDFVTQEDDDLPTLKDYKPAAEAHQKNVLLTFSPTKQLKDDDKYLRHSMTIDDDSYDQVLKVQHVKRPRKISSEFLKIADEPEQSKHGVTLRSLDFAKTRPSMTVSQYQTKNQKKDSVKKTEPPLSFGGLRLPGDSPLYGGSLSELRLIGAHSRRVETKEHKNNRHKAISSTVSRGAIRGATAKDSPIGSDASHATRTN